MKAPSDLYIGLEKEHPEEAMIKVFLLMAREEYLDATLYAYVKTMPSVDLLPNYTFTGAIWLPKPLRPGDVDDYDGWFENFDIDCCYGTPGHGGVRYCWSAPVSESHFMACRLPREKRWNGPKIIDELKRIYDNLLANRES